MPDPAGFSLIIIGTELLTGKRRDAHLDHALGALGKRALELEQILYLGDDPARLTREFSHSMAGADAVFVFGGIGATPDDHTRRCAAEAAGRDLIRHPAAAAIIEARFGDQARPQRIHMADLPRGCELIPNPVNRIPGFSLGHHHFMPGFPQMAWPMLDWVLDEKYPHLHGRGRPCEQLLTLPDVSEGQVIGILEDFVQRYPQLRLSCLPHMNDDYRETELGVRGDAGAVAGAMDWLRAQLRRQGFEWVEGGR